MLTTAKNAHVRLWRSYCTTLYVGRWKRITACPFIDSRLPCRYTSSQEYFDSNVDVSLCISWGHPMAQRYSAVDRLIIMPTQLRNVSPSTSAGRLHLRSTEGTQNAQLSSSLKCKTWTRIIKLGGRRNKVLAVARNITCSCWEAINKNRVGWTCGCLSVPLLHNFTLHC